MISKDEASSIDTVPWSLPTKKYRPFSSYLIDEPQLSREVWRSFEPWSASQVMILESEPHVAKKLEEGCAARQRIVSK